MRTIAIAEDYAKMRERIASLINQLPDVKLSCAVADGFELLTYLNTTKVLPDYVLVDIRMPVIDGVFTIDYISEHYPSISILALSAAEEYSIIIDTIKAGAKGFLNKKNLSIPMLKKSLGSICSNTLFFDDDMMATSVIQTFNLDTETKPNPFALIFSSKEKLFLQLSATMASNSQIASLMNVAESSLSNYQKSIKEKIGLHSRHELMSFAIREGIAKIARFHTSISNGH
jgi:DNA-binding NarL/FixJ family response regulator